MFRVEKNKMKKGFTLIELLAVMVAMFTVMGISVALLIQTFDFRRNYDEYSDGVRAVDRFVADFRNDVHVCGKPEIPGGDTLLRWNSATETVDYVTESDLFPDRQTIVRTVRKDGKKIRGEVYRLPRRMTLWFTDGKNADAGLVALSLWTTPPGTEPPQPDETNPFDRTLSTQRTVSRYAGNWRTIIARYDEEVKK